MTDYFNIPDLWDTLKEESEKDTPIVLYGTGDGADKILNVMEDRGIKASGIFASDTFVRKRVFRGFPVMSYKEAAKAFGENMIILIAFGSSLPEVIERFFALSSLHRVYVPDVPVCGGPVFDSGFYASNKDKIDKAVSLLADESSLKLYDSMIGAKLTGKIQYLCDEISGKDDILSFMGAENFETTLDLGAYNGDTALELCDLNGKLKTVIALEPDERNFKKLCINTAGTKKVEAHYAAATDKKEILSFTKGGGRGIHRKSEGKTVSVMGVPADSLLEGRIPDYIKIDVEGNEYQAVMGCKDSITKYSPTLRIALYHRSEDIFTLPLLINELNPNYNLYLKRTMSFPAWDLDLIAIKK